MARMDASADQKRPRKSDQRHIPLSLSLNFSFSRFLSLSSFPSGLLFRIKSNARMDIPSYSTSRGL